MVILTRFPPATAGQPIFFSFRATALCFLLLQNVPIWRTIHGIHLVQKNCGVFHVVPNGTQLNGKSSDQELTKTLLPTNLVPYGTISNGYFVPNGTFCFLHVQVYGAPNGAFKANGFFKISPNCVSRCLNNTKAWICLRKSQNCRFHIFSRRTSYG